jgi:hypothetical protein
VLHKQVTDVTGWWKVGYLPYILESNMHPGFGDLLNGKKLVRDSNKHISFNHPMPTWQLTE